MLRKKRIGNVSLLNREKIRQQNWFFANSDDSWNDNPLDVRFGLDAQFCKRPPYWEKTAPSKFKGRAFTSGVRRY